MTTNPPTETVSDYKNKEVSMSKTTMLDPKRGWIPAIEEPYYPSLLEKIKHFLGIHCWTITPHPRVCVICGKIEKRWAIFNKTYGGSTNNGNGYSHKTISLSIYTRLGSGDDGTRSNL